MKRTTATIMVLLMTAVLALGACGDSEEPVASDDGRNDPGTTEPASPAPPDEPPFIEGPIDTVTPSSVASDCEAVLDDDPDATVSSDDSLPKCTSKPTGDGLTVLIAPGTGTGSEDTASIGIGPDTVLLASDGNGGWEAGSMDDLAAGLVIRAWALGGEVLESYPVQFTASVLTYERTDTDTTSSGPTTSTPATTTPGSDPTGSAAPPATDPTTVGTVDGRAGGYCLAPDGGDEVECPAGTIGSLRVAAEGRNVDVIARVTPDTVILVADGAGGWREGSIDDVPAGAHVRLWVVEGALTKSIPAQGTAETVVVDG